MTDKGRGDSRALVILEQQKRLVWPEIRKYLKNPKYPEKFEIPERYRREEEFHWDLTCEYPERQGKYLRPSLVLLTCEAMGRERKKAVKTAAAMQISEEWLLIHDDIEDDSMMRRGKPALHRIFGKELAINAGDMLHIIMWKVLMDNEKELGREKTGELMEEFYRMLSRTAVGQTVEIKWARENRQQFSDEDWFFIADGKTSYYTIAGPMRLGAIVAGATKKQINLLTEFGVELGRCFQLVDDILDVTSDFGGLKKQKGNDVYEGKRTVILGHLMRTCKGEDERRLKRVLARSRSEKTEDEVRWVLEKMEEYGSIDYAKDMARQLKERAYKKFAKGLKFLTSRPARDDLEVLIDFVLERRH